MKKLIILFTMLLTVLVNARTFSQEEKKEMVRQFAVFQQALEKKDIKTLASMMNLPSEELKTMILDEEGEAPAGLEYGGKPLTAKEIEKYKDRVFKSLDALLYLKADTNSGKITNYFKDNATEEDKKRKYTYDVNSDAYYYMEKNTKKYLPDSRIWDDRVNAEFGDNGLIALMYWTPNRLTPKEPEGDGGVVYEFKFEKNKLKLDLIYWND